MLQIGREEDSRKVMELKLNAYWVEYEFKGNDVTPLEICEWHVH